MIKRDESWNIYSGPGLIDLQVNGIQGVDFNDLALKEEDVLQVTQYLLSIGVTVFFPTVITNSDENILSLLHILANACKTYPLVKECIYGIHLEGPFISLEEGARGAHNAKYIKLPNWELFEKFQQAAEGKIRLVTLAPERDGACSFIKKCVENNILVSMGHSMANTEQIRRAVDAGMTLSTHLGNAVPLMVKRHPNMIWDQLADDRLYAMIIADGLHIPDSFIKVVMKVKGTKTILVSDATRFAGMIPGEYESTIGGTVVLDAENRISLKRYPGLLAGAAKNLLENVETVVNHGLATLDDAWQMASDNAANLMEEYFPGFKNNNEDHVRFQYKENTIQIQQVIKNGKMVYEQSK